MSGGGDDDDEAPSLAALDGGAVARRALPRRSTLNGQRVGPFGWKGIGCDRKLLRAKLGGENLGRIQRPAPGSDEEKDALREMVLRV